MGGKWSDIKYARSKAQNGGKGYPEVRLLSLLALKSTSSLLIMLTRLAWCVQMRLKSTLIMMALLPPSVLAYAWTCQKHTHIAGPVICLFISGFAVLYVLLSCDVPYRAFALLL
jgi:hypothetical protein